MPSSHQGWELILHRSSPAVGLVRIPLSHKQRNCLWRLPLICKKLKAPSLLKSLGNEKLHMVTCQS
jgi:hypothetical protein